MKYIYARLQKIIVCILRKEKDKKTNDIKNNINMYLRSVRSTTKIKNCDTRKKKEKKSASIAGRAQNAGAKTSRLRKFYLRMDTYSFF